MICKKTRQWNSCNVLLDGGMSYDEYVERFALAVRSIPNAFITASVVLSVGLPFSLNERYSCSRDKPV